MQVVSIGSANHADQILERLNYEFGFLREEGINIDVQRINRGNLTFLGCKLVRGNREKFSQEDMAAIFRHFVANALSEVIVNDWEETLIRKFIRDNYSYFSKEEQDRVYEFVVKALDGYLAGDKDLFHKVTRKGKVLAKLVDYLNRHNELVLEGFVTFRLKEYVEELQESVDRAVDDYLMEKEYREFIRLLKYFVDAQESKMEEVHVFVRSGEPFRLSDGEGKPVAREYLDDLILEVSEEGADCEDLLISSLITLAPKKIVLHMPGEIKESAAIETLRRIFGDRLSICNGCFRCDAARRSTDT